MTAKWLKEHECLFFQILEASKAGYWVLWRLVKIWQLKKKISKFLKLGVGIVTCWQISHSNKQKIALVWLGPKEKKKGTNYILMERLQLDFHHIIEKHV